MTKGRTRMNLGQRKYIKNKAVKKFVLHHLVKEEIDLSKFFHPFLSRCIKI